MRSGEGREGTTSDARGAKKRAQERMRKQKQKQKQKRQKKQKNQEDATEENEGDGGGARLRQNEYMSCMQDAAILAAEHMERALDKEQIYAELPPGDSYVSIAALKAAPSVAAVLSLTFENFAQKLGGPVFALFQLESGPPRFLLAETEGKTSTGHEFARHAAVFFPETRMLVDNVSKRHVARSIDKLSARQLFDVFFGGPTRLRQVYIVT